MNTYDIVVIGAGPAGMMAAIEAKINNKYLNIAIADKNNEMGKKLLITGGGRCNITNAQDIEVFFKNVVRNPKFLYSAFNNFTNKDLMDFFENKGLKLKKEGNKIYPLEDDAKGVLNILINELKKLQINEFLGFDVSNISINNDNHSEFICINSEKGNKIYAKKLIIATGGASYKNTGSDGKLFELLRYLELDIKPIIPTLVKLNSNQEWITKSQGISLSNTKFTINYKNKKLAEVEGSIVFTHNGISGPAAINSSAYITDKEICDISIFIDLIPEISEQELKDTIKNKDKKNLDTKLSKLIPKELVKNMLLYELGIEKAVIENDIQNMKKNDIQNIVNVFKGIKLNLTGYGGINEAIVTRGGVSIKEINPKTLNLKKYPDIYVAGEMVDIDAFTGGFNLQIAFSTGYLAGKSASQSF